jgi:hypothetical protein
MKPPSESRGNDKKKIFLIFYSSTGAEGEKKIIFTVEIFS